MRKRQKPRLALCPIGKFVFSHEDALRQKNALRGTLNGWDVEVVDLENILPDGMVRDQTHVDAVVEHFQRADADALFIPHCNFGTEGAAAMIARRLGLPTLLWGPRDEAPQADGTRLRDSLCGMFATSKVLRRLRVPFTYVENCRLDEAPFREGVDRFLRAANVARLFREGMRIGQVGLRIDFFWTTIIDEGDLLDRFGIEVLPLDLVDCIRQVRERAGSHADAYRLEAEAWKERMGISP